MAGHRVLVVGSGGREHALAWACSRSPSCEAVFVALGNGHTVGTQLGIAPSNTAALLSAIHAHAISLVIIGPEAPLVAGLADALRAQGIAVVGPSAAAAQLEGSKAFSKAFMQRHGIPTARYATFNRTQLQQAHQYVAHPLPVVVKASGLAAGKGVLICTTLAEAQAAVTSLLTDQQFGEAGEEIVVEEFLDGVEVSVFALCNGTDYVLLPAAKDYKRIGEGDTGLNTGGMGAVSPVPFADEAFLKRVGEAVIAPTLRGMACENRPFNGFLFVGLMVVAGEPYVLEYNVRLGDPEAQCILPRIDTDFANLLWATATGDLRHRKPVPIRPETAVTVVSVSAGYPGTYTTGHPISGLEDLGGVLVFHAGTKWDGNQLVTHGGRVLAVTALGADLPSARQLALDATALVQFEGHTYRRDIGQDLLGR